MAGPNIFIKDEFGSFRRVVDFKQKTAPNVKTRILRALHKTSSGEWVVFYRYNPVGDPTVFSITYSSLFLNQVNPFVDVGSPSGIIELNILITGAGDIVDRSGNVSMIFTGINPNSTVNIFCNGLIGGQGGRGGGGGSFNEEPPPFSTSGEAGALGSTAIEAGCNLNITGGSGRITAGFRGGRGGDGSNAGNGGAGGGGGGGVPYGLGGLGGFALTSPPPDGSPGNAADASQPGSGGAGSGTGQNGNRGRGLFGDTVTTPAIISGGFIVSVDPAFNLVGEVV